MNEPNITENTEIANRYTELIKAEDELNLSNSSSEVSIGPHICEPQAWQLDDTVAILSSDEDNSVILGAQSNGVNMPSPLDHCLSDNFVPSSSPVEHFESTVPLLPTIQEDSVTLSVASTSSASTLLSPNNQSLSNSSFQPAATEQPAPTFVPSTLMKGRPLGAAAFLLSPIIWVFHK